MENNKPSFFSVTPATVRYDKRLKPLARLLYGEITALANSKGYCWASNQYFADLYEVSKQTVSAWVNQLLEFGYIRVEIIYKEGSKEIQGRYIYIFDEPTLKIMNTPILKNAKDNTTASNSTVINTNETVFVPFERFWSIYPRHDTKAESQKKWLALKVTEAMLDQMQRVITASKQSEAWTKDNGKFIPMPATWLNKRRWEDEVTGTSPTPQTTDKGQELMFDEPF
jgi:hypothetical protein